MQYLSASDPLRQAEGGGQEIAQGDLTRLDRRCFLGLLGHDADRSEVDLIDVFFELLRRVNDARDDTRCGRNDPGRQYGREDLVAFKGRCHRKPNPRSFTAAPEVESSRAAVPTVGTGGVRTRQGKRWCGLIAGPDRGLRKVSSPPANSDSSSRTIVLVPAPSGYFDFPLPHLSSHMRSLEPVRVTYEVTEGGTNLAIEIGDAPEEGSP